MICRCFVIMSSVMRCCRCILCNRSPLRRNSYDSTNLSPCKAILSASNSCTRHINDKSSRSVSESKRFGRFYKQSRKRKHLKHFGSLNFFFYFYRFYYGVYDNNLSIYVFQSHSLLPDRVQFADRFWPECYIPFLFVFYIAQVRPRLVHVQLVIVRRIRVVWSYC